jgi:hypothetical protein
MKQVDSALEHCSIHPKAAVTDFSDCWEAISPGVFLT